MPTSVSFKKIKVFYLHLINFQIDIHISIRSVIILVSGNKYLSKRYTESHAIHTSPECQIF